MTFRHDPLRRAVRTVAITTLALSTVAGPAAADFTFVSIPSIPFPTLPLACPTPTPVQCVDAAYQESSCGRERIAAGDCVGAIESVMSTAPVTGSGIAGDEDGGYLWSDRLAPASTASDYDYGFGASYQAALGQHATEIRNPALAAWVWWKPSAGTKRAAWAANGNAVASCEELAYEGWWTYSQFEDEVARRGSDARAIFDAARLVDLGAGPVRDREGSGVLRSDGTVAPGLPLPTSAIPKNAYFWFRKTAFDKYPIPDWALPSSAGSSYYAGNWAWHLSMDQQLRELGWPDELLDAEYARQKRFVRLLEKRARILDALTEEATRATSLAPGVLAATTSSLASDSYAIGVTSASALAAATVESEVATLSPSLVSSLVATSTATSPSAGGFTGGYTGNLGALYVIDQQLSRELEHAAAWGCLSTTGPSVCDWSPRMFADLISTAYVKEREEEYQRCMYLTGDDFSDSAPIGNPTAFDLPAWARYRSTSWLTRWFLMIYSNHLDNIDFTPEPGTPTEPSIGWWRDGARWMGNDSWGAGYSYKLGFGLLKGEEGGQCVMNLKAGATASATGTLAGWSFNLLDSDTYAVTTSDRSMLVHSHTTVVGKALYEPVNKTLTGTDHANVFHAEKELAKDQTFFIGPIMVTATVGVVGKAGLNVASDVVMDRSCGATPKIDLTGTFSASPYFQADAFASVLVGAKLLGAGLQTNLTLVRVDAPITITPNVHGRGADLAQLASSTIATITARLNLTVDSLSGSVKGVVKTPFKNWEKTIFSWEGKRLVDETWERSWRFPLGKVMPKLGA